MDKIKINEFIKDFKRGNTPYGDQFDFKLGICYVLLGDFKQAQSLFETSFLGMFSPPIFWKKSSQAYRLIDICILSGRLDLLGDVIRELQEFKSDPTGDSPAAHYSYAVAGLLSPATKNINDDIEVLLKHPRFKISIAWGNVLQAVVTQNQPLFDLGLADLIQVHKGQATHGDLRWSPDGWLCLSAMSLIHLGLKENLKVNVTSDYISPEYLEFLYEQKNK
jgi:hypothetical protein